MQQAVSTTEIPLHWIQEEGTRLDASYYTQDSIEARVLLDELEENGVELESVDGLAEDVFHRSRFKRDYVSEGNGEPYLTPTDMFMFPLEPRKYITDPPEGLKADSGWLLVTCSGTVGRTIIANEYLSECILTHDLIRILPESFDYVGYLHTYLSTWIGQALLVKDEYGATVKHIEPEHVQSIRVPRLPTVESNINQLILTAHEYREEAERTMRKVIDELHEELELSPVGELDKGYLSVGSTQSGRAFTANAGRIADSVRLDAPHHKPIIQQITGQVSESKYKSTNLGAAIEGMYVPSRFKRAYVDSKDNGVPFLSGSHLVQIKPLDIKYLWENMEGIEELMLEEGQILMSRSGTVGRVRPVDEHIADWTASEHCLRINPRANVNPGYLVAFLRSPYGQYQIEAKVYGAVVDEIAESDTSLIEDIDIVLPPDDVQKRIGEKVFEAYNRIDEANEIENRAIRQLEEKLVDRRGALAPD